LVFLGYGVFPCEAELQTKTLADAGAFAQVVLEEVQLQSDGSVTLTPQAQGTNLALGHLAVDEYGKTVPLCDGSVALGVSEWLSGTPNVLERTFTLDLGMDRAISRVRILPGGTAELQPEYFIRGYRLEAATQRQPEIWYRLAEQPTNFKLTVDTSNDATWSTVDQLGKPVPRVGRYVKLTIIRQDRSNWVSLGDIEVYGTGYSSEGQLTGVFDFPGPVNVGQIRWQGETPAGTQVHILAGAAGDDQESPLLAEPSASLFSGAEPVDGLQYRAALETADPLVTPTLRQLEVDWDSVLVAHKALGSVWPDTARKGSETEVLYRVDLEVGPGDYGLDLLRVGMALSVEAVRLDGVGLAYDSRSDAEEGSTLVDLGEPITASGVLEIAGRGLFLKDRTAISVAVGNRAQGNRDGYVNWQNAGETPGGTWTVRGIGRPPSLLSDIKIAPRPFSPFRDREMEFSFVVSNLQQDTEISIEIFSLAGVKIRRLSQVGGARVYRLEWDGRDQDGRIAVPGLYLYAVRVDAEDNAASRTGTLVVAY
jgi:hypothetical protein